MWPNPQETADVVTFTGEILNGKFNFLCGDVLQFGKAKWIEKDWSNNISLLDLYHLIFIMASLHCKNMKYVYNSVAYLGLPQHFKTELLVTLVKNWKPLANVASSSILDAAAVLDTTL